MYSSTLTNGSRIARFSSKNGGASIRAQGNIPLTLEALEQAIPSIFAEDKHVSRSARYSYIPTSQILTGLEQEGFQPFAAYQGGSRDEEKRGFTKHMIRLRHRSEQLDLSKVGSTVSEIVLVNSHDGTSSYKMMGGKFRLVCSNGMIVSDGLMKEVKVAHKGNIQEDVINGCIEILADMPAVDESMREMMSIELSDAEQALFGRTALTVRYDDEESPIKASQVIAARRREDTGRDLWSVFNRVQENITRGGINYIHTSPDGYSRQRRQTREIRGIDQNTAINRALWELAEGMADLKLS